MPFFRLTEQISLHITINHPSNTLIYVKNLTISNKHSIKIWPTFCIELTLNALFKEDLQIISHISILAWFLLELNKGK
jgi:hypothetical protein